MEYAKGGTLRNLLRDKKFLSEVEAYTIFKQIVLAMSYCHKKKCIHRDLKLENILLADKDSTDVRIVDFGIAGLISNNEV